MKENFFFEISKHELKEIDPKLIKYWLNQFRELVPTGILGDNLIFVWANDFYEIWNKAKAYERLIGKTYK